MATALAAVAKWHGMKVGDLQAGAPVLSIYDPRLLGPGQGGPVRLVWRLEVTPLRLLPIRELVLVDARTGGVALHFNQVDTAKNRITYTAGDTGVLPGTQLCTEGAGDVCTSGADTNTEANYAHLYAGATYDFYQTYHGRDSFDDQGATLVSTVDFNDGESCPNAYWDGSQMVYCQGFPEADDVVAHELTHAVTDMTSQLLYYYQSGAINESLSDLWGEFVDLTDNSGNDDPSVRWLLGEEINSPATQPAMVGAIRDMKNPPAYHDPDRITSAYYYTGPDDSGGVHTNSGVNNKAVYLLTDGGSFNGQVVTGLGIAKVAKIYYEAQTNYLTSGSDYQDLGRDLNQACANLVGTAGITLTDCDQVLKATVAVEMDRQPAANFNPEAEICPAGVAVNDTFFDDFESGLGKWSLTKAGGNQTWIGFRSAVGYPYATSGVESLFGPDVEVISDQQATIAVTVPAGQPYLHFRHAFDFEYDPAGGPAYYDGGVLEYSVNNGSSWIDAKNLIDAGKNYSGTIYNGLDGDNPLKGKAAYVGASHGYVSTRLNLTPLAGTNVKFRWRVGTDTGIGNLGWSLDDVRVYTCGNSSPVSNNPPTAVAGPAQTVYTGSVVTLNGGGSSDPGGNIVAYAWTQTGGTAVHLDNASAVVAGFTAPYKATILTFRLTVTDNDGAAASSETKVTVKMPIATASAGGGGGGGCSLSRNGEADPLPFLLFLASLVMAWRRRRRAASS